MTLESIITTPIAPTISHDHHLNYYLNHRLIHHDDDRNDVHFREMRKKPRPPHKSPSLPFDDPLFAVRRRKAVPFEFVLDALASLSPRTHPMFGCLAVYVGEKIVLILRDKESSPRDNGVWLATTADHHASLRRDFPGMRSIAVLGKEITSWQVLAADRPDFERAAMRACEFVLARDPRIGKVPGSRPASKRTARKRSAQSADNREKATNKKKAAKRKKAINKGRAG